MESAFLHHSRTGGDIVYLLKKAIGQVTSPNQIINKWRHYNNGEVCEPPKKKMKSKRNPEAKAMLAGYHANIKQCFVGVFLMKIDCLIPANDTRMVRMQDGDFVKSLTARMLSKRSICIDSAPPVIGLIDKNICPSKSSFSDDLLERGAIEVIDGNHSVLAQKAAFEATKEKVFEKRLVAVYAGLTDQQALSLGVSKNQDACHVLKMTPIEEIKLFRRELYYTNNIPLTEEPPLPTSLYYSTIKHILGISTKSAMDSKRMAIKLASLSKRCFAILEALMKEKPGLKAYKFQALQGIAEENDVFKCLQRFQRDRHDEFLVKWSEIKGTINTTQSNHHKLEVHVTPQTIHVTKLHHANTATITLNGKSREWKADELFQALTDYTRKEAMDLEGSGPLESSILSGIGDEEEEESNESDNDSHVDTGKW
nr:uncharacterized protein LOC129264618 [Lytechinus pictus]